MNKVNTQWFRIGAVDAWFFRDGRPSNRDEDQSDLQSQFPPPHQTLVGAIRAGIARGNGWTGQGDWPDSVKAVLGDGFENLGQLSFDGPYVAFGDRALFPAPSHVLGTVQRKEVNDPVEFTPAAWLQPSPEKITTDMGSVHLPVLTTARKSTDPEVRFKPANEFLIDTDGMNLVLNGKLPQTANFVHLSQLFAFESRVGIEREYPARTTGSNAMYHPTYVRLKNNVSILLGINGVTESWMPPNVFPLGGEARLATLEKIAEPAMPKSAENGDMVLLVTPARFNGECWFGAGPDAPAAALAGEFSGNVQTASVDRPRFIGGFDSRKGSKGPLPLTPFAPPGSVWWLAENVRTNPDSAPLRIGTHVAYGYGRALVGLRIAAN